MNKILNKKYVLWVSSLIPSGGHNREKIVWQSLGAALENQTR
jgi:hypothetical protein